MASTPGWECSPPSSASPSSAWLYGLEDVADRVGRGPEWLRPAVGGLALGGLLLALPQMYGVGYPILESAIRTSTCCTVLLFIVTKMVATSLTIAIGGPGGVFAPSLFIGAMLGHGRPGFFPRTVCVALVLRGQMHRAT